MYRFYVFIFVCFVIVARICFMIFFAHKKKQKHVVRTKPVKTMIILGSGGHTAEMIRILQYLNFKNYSPRIYIHADTDIMSMEKIKNLEKNNTDYKVFKIRRSRELHQSYYTSIYTTIYAIVESIPLLLKQRPKLLLCNGPSTCVPLCITTFLFKVFYIMQTNIIYVESFCRVKTLSLTGKILYYIVDYQIVQWPYLTTPNDKNDRTFYL